MILDKKRSLYRIGSLILAVVFLSLSRPYYMWHNTIVYAIILFLLASYSLSHFHFKLDNKVLFIIFYMLIMAYGLRNASIDTTLLALSSIFILFIPQYKIMKIADCFILVYSCILVLSLIVYFLVAFGNMDLPNRVIPPINEVKNYEYQLYPFVLFPFGGNIFLRYRFHFIYDEPGVVGTIAVFLLVIKKYQLDNWKAIAIFLSGIFSFSFFFIAMSIIYLCWGRLKLFLWLGIISVFTISIFYDDPIVEKFVLERFEISDAGKGLHGNNRVHPDFEVVYKEFCQSDKFLLGVGEIRRDPSLTSSSYKNVIFHDGILYFILFVSFFILLGVVNLKSIKNLMIYCFLLFGMLYQRPGINHVFYFFLFYSVIVELKSRESSLLCERILITKR